MQQMLNTQNIKSKQYRKKTEIDKQTTLVLKKVINVSKYVFAKKCDYYNNLFARSIHYYKKKLYG